MRKLRSHWQFAAPGEAWWLIDLNSRIPFYYAEEATEAIKPVLGDLYYTDNRSFHGQLWSVFNKCKYVEKNPEVPGAMRWHKDA